MSSRFGLSYRLLEQGDPLEWDLDLRFLEVEDDRVPLWEALALLSTPQGALFWAPEATVSLPELLLSSLSKASLSALHDKLAAIFEEDRRFLARTDLRFEQGRLVAEVNLELTGSPRRFVASVSDGRVAISEVTGA